MVIMGGFLFFCSAVLVGIVSGAGTQPSDSEVGAIGAILGAFGYLKISGGSFATLRSFVMIANFFLSNLADQQAIALRNVALAALAILLMFPESVVDPGFQMSFAAVVGQVASYEVLAGRAEPWVQGRPSWHWRIIAFLAAIVGSTLVASATVAPIGIYDFHQVQYLAVLANFLAVPFCNLIVMPAGLATLVLMPFWGGGRSALGQGLGLEMMEIWRNGSPACRGRKPCPSDSNNGNIGDNCGWALFMATSLTLAASGCAAYCARRCGRTAG